MGRQVEMVASANCFILVCEDLADAENAKTLFTKCQNIEIEGEVRVTGDIGEKGWAVLAEALSTIPAAGPWDVQVSRQNMLGGKREDLRKVWDSLQAGSSEWVIELGTREAAIFKREGAEDGWDLVEQMMELSEEEIFAKAQEEGVDNIA